MAPSLLPELVSDILLCLPVASLLRFRCLSTSHCAEIDSANFAKHQLKRSIKTRTGCKLLILQSYPTNLSYFLYADIEKDDVDLDFKPHWTHLPASLHRVDIVRRSFNGLILLELKDSDRVLSFAELKDNDRVLGFALWNPFTKRHKELPPCPAINLPEFKHFKCYGLGVDSALEEYKVVVIPEFSGGVYQVWIFSLGSNCWRNVEIQHRDILFTASKPGYFANGSLYWVCGSRGKRTKTGSSTSIMGFDLTKEQLFDILTLPCSDGFKDRFCPTLASFEGNVYMQKHDHMIGVVELYRLMCDERGDVVWVKEFALDHYIFQLISYIRPVLRSRKGDSILFMDFLYSRAFWYNLESKQVQNLDINCGIPNRRWSLLLCQESLVSPGLDSVLDQAACLEEEEEEEEEEEDDDDDNVVIVVF